MIITFAPIRMDEPLIVTRAGDSLILNGKAIVLSTYTDGDSPWIIGRPERVAGTWHVTLLAPHGAEAADGARWPGSLAVTADGPVLLPDGA